MEEKKICVNIRASQVVHYDQTVEMTPAEWVAIKDVPANKIADAIDSWLDKNNVFDADGIDNDNLDLMVVDEQGIAVSPPDAYGVDDSDDDDFDFDDDEDLDYADDEDYEEDEDEDE